MISVIDDATLLNADPRLFPVMRAIAFQSQVGLRAKFDGTRAVLLGIRSRNACERYDCQQYAGETGQGVHHDLILCSVRMNLLRRCNACDQNAVAMKYEWSIAGLRFRLGSIRDPRHLT